MVLATWWTTEKWPAILSTQADFLKACPCTLTIMLYMYHIASTIILYLPLPKHRWLQLALEYFSYCINSWLNLGAAIQTDWIFIGSIDTQYIRLNNNFRLHCIYHASETGMHLDQYAHHIAIRSLYLPSGMAPYPLMLRNLSTAKLDVKMVVSYWNMTDACALVHLSNFRALGQL